MLAAGMHRIDSNQRFGGSNVSGNNYQAYGSLPGANSTTGGYNQLTRDEFGNTVPMPLMAKDTAKQNDYLM